MNRFHLFIVGLALLLVACAQAEAPATETLARPENVLVYRSPTWGCCSDWIAYMEENGFDVEVRDVDDLTAIKAEYGIPPQFQSCHTAIVDGYIVEGHVPAADINRLLMERPAIVGVAVPGMPLGSPGMEMPGGEFQPFDVIAFSDDGTVAVFNSYSE